jgi:putative cell wall-binding protein
MKKFLLMFCSLVVLISCNSTKKAQEQNNVSYKELRGYFLNNTYSHTDKVEFVVVNSQAEMDALLGVAKTMTNKIDVPDFSTNSVGILICQPTTSNLKLSIKQMNVTNTLNVEALIEEQSENNSYTSSPILVVEFPKQDASKNLNFSFDWKR